MSEEDRAFRTTFLAEYPKPPESHPQMAQIDADAESESANCKSIGLGSEPLTVLRSGFIQIESVKSVVKNSGVWLRGQPRQIFTEGNEDPLPAHIARFVLLVISCSNL